MQVSKHLHACLLIKEKDFDILIDPGMFTDEENAVDLSSFTKLDYIFYTHEHADHLSVPYLKKILQKFPDAKIITNNAIVSILAKEQIKATMIPPEWASAEDAHHERLVPGMTMPENTSFTLFTTLTHPGDSLSFTKTARVLALPVTAPWGSMIGAIEKALEIKPEIVLPIHDWHWKDAGRKQMYGMMTNIFSQHGIEFKPLETNEVVTV